MPKTRYKSWFILILTFSIIFACSSDGQSELNIGNVPTLVEREGPVTLKGFSFVYEDKRIVEVAGKNTSYIEYWIYDDSKLSRIDFQGIDRVTEQYYLLEYDSNDRLARFFYKSDSADSYYFQRIDLEYFEGNIVKNVYEDRGFPSSEPDGILEFIYSERLIYENGNIIRIENSQGEGFFNMDYSYGKRKSPLINVTNFEIIQIIFTTDHYRGTILNGFSEMFMGRNNMKDRRYDSSELVESFPAEFANHNLPYKISTVNQFGKVSNVMNISYE